ncbi:TetR/AcrR family transcriptional regulator [Burkholderia alba]|uniref:TetR/AcrR family transcriptional regulator n=1 Tax=Burkholderia alba TaxID=2683677 RepID=UPI002B0568D2|nr:helix-turn-helix domain-containing protein [Burkholderia alba]
MSGSDALLKSARLAFARSGFEATSVREIARRADVNPALVAHHFGSKEELWLAVVDQIAERTALLRELTGALRSSGLAPRRRVEQALVLFVDEVFSEPDIGMFFSTAATEQGERLNVLVDRLVRPYHEVFVPLLADAMDAGELLRNDPTVVFAMLTNAVSKTVAYRHVLSAFSPIIEQSETFKRAVIDAAFNMLH